MPDCNQTPLAEQATLQCLVMAAWRKLEVTSYAGICSCKLAQAMNAVILSTNSAEVCRWCGRPVRLTRIARYTPRLIDQQWYVEERNG